MRSNNQSRLVYFIIICIVVCAGPRLALPKTRSSSGSASYANKGHTYTWVKIDDESWRLEISGPNPAIYSTNIDHHNIETQIDKRIAPGIADPDIAPITFICHKDALELMNEINSPTNRRIDWNNSIAGQDWRVWQDNYKTALKDTFDLSECVDKPLSLWMEAWTPFTTSNMMENRGLSIQFFEVDQIINDWAGELPDYCELMPGGFLVKGIILDDGSQLTYGLTLNLHNVIDMTGQAQLSLRCVGMGLIEVSKLDGTVILNQSNLNWTYQQNGSYSYGDLLRVTPIRDSSFVRDITLKWKFHDKTDEIKLTVVPPCLDLDVDSDNDNVTHIPEQDDNEDTLEGNDPGKIILLNDDDDDADGIADDIDGFDHDASEPNDNANNSEDDLYPVVLKLHDLATATTRIRLTYSSANPDGTIFGGLRLWTTNGTTRNKNAVTQGGHFVESGELYPASTLGMEDGYQNFYMEGITQGTYTIAAQVDVDNGGSFVADYMDQVKVTVIPNHRLDLAIYNGQGDLGTGRNPDPILLGSEVLNVEEETLGAYLLVNWDDDDSSGIQNAVGEWSTDPVPDLSEEQTAMSEDNLAKLVITMPNLPTQGIIELEVTQQPDKVKIWKNQFKGDASFKIGPLKTFDLANSAQRSDFQTTSQNGLWIEGIAASDSERDVEMVVRYKLDGQVVSHDTVKATVVMIKLGCGVYREMASDLLAEKGHTGLMTRYEGQCVRDDLLNPDKYGLSEMQMTPENGFRLPTWQDFYNQARYWGTYESSPTYVQRLKILGNVSFLRSVGISYNLADCIQQKGLTWDGTLFDILELRCDGLVEVCLESAGESVWGEVFWPSTTPQYSIIDYCESHQNWLFPSRQCGKDSGPERAPAPNDWIIAQWQSALSTTEISPPLSIQWPQTP